MSARARFSHLTSRAGERGGNERRGGNANRREFARVHAGLGWILSASKGKCLLSGLTAEF